MNANVLVLSPGYFASSFQTLHLDDEIEILWHLHEVVAPQVRAGFRKIPHLAPDGGEMPVECNDARHEDPAPFQLPLVVLLGRSLIFGHCWHHDPSMRNFR